MLSSIHPLGERSRSNRYWLTVSAYLVGSLVGGLATGAAAGGLGELAGLGDLSDGIRALALAAAAAATLAADLRPRPVSHVHRQVDERWLGTYRGWVYGLGYGLQLGCGLVTIVSSATVYLWIAAAVLSGSVTTGAVLGAVFGAVRGLVLLTGAGLDSPDGLRRFHRRLDRVRPASRRAAQVVSASVVVLALAVVAT